jgi:flagellar hook-basal body complex protein FliE
MLPPITSISTALTGSAGPASMGNGSILSPHSPGFSSAASADGSGGPASPFSDLLTDAVGQVDQLESQARTAVSGLMTGNGVDVHQAMIATQKADMTFEMALAVRNKAVQAYQSVIGMQF